MADNFSEAIDAFKKGDRRCAEKIIRDLILKQPDVESHWIWLERCVEDKDQKIEALQKVLTINPTNRKAQTTLDSLLIRSKNRIGVAPNVSSNIFQNTPAESGRNKTPAGPIQAIHLAQAKKTSAQDIFADLLDPDQLRAVNHRGSSLLIIAGAGSGKTRTLTYRAISFLDEIEPEDMMIVTFTKKAANEISNRIMSIVPGSVRKSLKKAWIGTIHSICWRMLMENGYLVGLQPNWSVLDQTDSMRVMEICARPYGFKGNEAARNLFQLHSYARNSMTDWQKLANTQRFPNAGNPANIQKAVESYTRRCRRSNRVDFDDLQILALRLLAENPAICSAYQDRFKLIMVDEYQDTNLVQSLLLANLASIANTITVVGDDAQSIYGFRAATVENILTFEQQFQAKRITIGTNYRSTPEIVALANASIKNNHQQILKDIQAGNPPGEKPKLFLGITPSVEAQYILQQIQSRLYNGEKLENMSVLFRATRLAAGLQLELKQAGIPYVVVGGDDFFTLEHIKYILDCLRLLVNPEDSIALGSLQQLIKFSSDSALESIEEKADLGQLSFWDMAKNYFTTAAPALKPEYQSLLKFQADISQLTGSLVDGQSITPAISNVINYLTPYIREKYPMMWDDIKSDFEILQTIAAPYISVSDFLNSIALDQFEEIENQSAEKPLVLSTIHSAKGLEWDTVFVIGLVEFWFPLNFAIQQSGTDEEERRLFYVATTRAKKNLYLTSYTQSLNNYGQTKMQVTSRFIKELPAGVYNIVK